MIRTLTLLVCMLLVSPAFSQNYVVWTGGIGAEEREEAPDTGTRFEFFVRSGSYLSDVNVVIRNAAGNEIVNTLSTGPWLVLNLPDGQYDVRATLEDGRAQGVSITVGEGTNRYGFMFPEQ